MIVGRSPYYAVNSCGHDHGFAISASTLRIVRRIPCIVFFALFVLLRFIHDARVRINHAARGDNGSEGGAQNVRACGSCPCPAGYAIEQVGNQKSNDGREKTGDE